MAVQTPANANRGRSSPSANQIGVLRGFVSAYSQNDVAGDVAALLAKPTPPMRALDVADVGDWRAAELRRSRHSPARHEKLALPIGPHAHDRRELVGEDRRQKRQVAGAVVRRAEEVADGRLALGHAVEVAHVAGLCSNRTVEQTRSEMLSWLRRRRARIERIEAEAEALIRNLGDWAYSEARRWEHEASQHVGL